MTAVLEATKKELGTVNPFTEGFWETYYNLLAGPRNFVKSAVFYRYIKSISICGLSAGNRGDCIICDNLSKSGYSNSYLYPQDIDSHIQQILNYMPISFEDAAFIQNKEVLYFDFEEEIAYECSIVELKDYGYYKTFLIEFEDGTKKEVASSNYDHIYCFLEKEPIFQPVPFQRVVIFS